MQIAAGFFLFYQEVFHKMKGQTAHFLYKIQSEYAILKKDKVFLEEKA